MGDDYEGWPLENGDYMLPPIVPQWLSLLMFLFLVGSLIVGVGAGCWAAISFHP